MFRKKLVGGHLLVPCVVCNFSAVVLNYGKTIQVVPCLCVKNKGEK